jgi:outer membrane immunogenic protein
VAMGVAAPAIAADLPAAPYSKAAPVWMPAMYDWSGLYVGLNGGWGSSRNCWDSTPGGVFAGTEGCHNATGGLVGAQAGFRWQTGALVVGLEAQGDWANLRGSNQSVLLPADINRSHVDAFGLFTGQLGYAINTALLYVKGGGALTANRFDVLTTPGNALAATATVQTRFGGAAGAGVEFSFAPNWSAAVEYDHLFMGKQTSTFTATGGGVFGTDSIRQDADLVTARVNYRWGGPVIAKY